jgi:uncharacterized membrane protein YraQ (UPF0718 family)
MFEKIGNYAAFNLLALDPDSSLGAAVQFFVMDVIKILVLLVVIIYLMGLLRAYISPERVRKVIQGKPKWFARLMAILLGSVTPFCSCSSVPLFIGFVEAGIPMGVTFSFLIASPMINEIAVVMLASILGWEIALMYVGAGLVVAYVGGLIMERFKTERWVESYVWKIQMGETDNTQKKQTLTQRHEYALNEVKTIVLRIWKWIFIGIAIGAAFHGYVPQQWVTDHLSSTGNWWTVPLAVLIGVPLYSDTVGVIPILEAMLGKGVPLGTSLAFMMSIAALSLPELLILRKVIQWPALALFVGVLTTAFILVGWSFNFIQTIYL